MKKLFAAAAALLIGSAAPALAQTWEVTYPSDGKASSIDVVQVTCAEVGYKFLADDATASLYDSSNNLVRTLQRDDITINQTNKGSSSRADFEFSPAVDTVGKYTLSVPAGTFLTNSMVPSEAFSVELEVVEQGNTPVDATFTCVSPAGGKAASLEYIILSSSVAWDEVASSASGAVYNSKMETVVSLDSESIFIYNGALMVYINPAITTPGSYTLVIYENSLVCTSQSVTNNMAMINLTVEADAPAYDFTSIPADYSSVSQTTGISEIYITVNGYSYDAPNTGGIQLSITKDSQAFATVGASALSLSMDQASARISLPENAVLNQLGEYVVTIPQGFFLMKAEGSSEAVESPAVELHYTITAPEEPLEWTISPAPGVVDKISQVQISFNKAVQVAQTSDVYLFYSAGAYFMENVTEGRISVSDDGKLATIDFNPVFQTGGVFQIRLYEGSEQLSVADGEYFPGIDITYIVDAPLYTESQPEAGSTLAKLQETKVLLPRNTKVAKTDKFAAWYVCGDKKVAANLTKLVQYDFGDPTYLLLNSEEPVAESGDWNLVIEKGSLTISNYGESMESPEISIPFKVDSTLSVEANWLDEGVCADVYSLQGILLIEAASAEQIRALAPGAYIVNGRKFLVK